MIIKEKVKNLFVIILIFVMLINPYTIIISIKNALIMCYESVIPSLYIFMVFSNYIAQSNIIGILAVPLSWYSKLMKIEDRIYPAYLLISLIGGFAVGANYIKKLKISGYPQKALNVLSVSMINNSLSFCVFAVGSIYLDNAFIGLYIYISLVLSSLITSFILSFQSEYNIVSPAKIPVSAKPSFVKSVNDAVDSILSICGFIIIFYTICEVFLLYAQKTPILSVIIPILTEVTTACMKISRVIGKNPYLMIIALSFLPVCTLCQIFHFTEDAEIIKSLIFSRIIHTPVTIIIYSVISNIFPVAVHTANTDNLIIRSYSYSMELSFTLFRITFAFLKIFNANKVFTKYNK